MRKVFLLRAACISIAVASLGGCAEKANWNPESWFGGNTVAHPATAPQTPKAPAAPPRAPASPPQAQLQTGKVKVALLLPLSGPNAALGHAMLNAAQQAVFDAAPPNFELITRDTGSNEEAATDAAHDAIANGAQLLIGPLFAVNVPAVHSIAAAAGLPELTLSTDTSLASPGLYVMGFSPTAQAERVARFAVARGLKRFAILVPSNAYGTLVAQAFNAAAVAAGGSIVSLDSYDPAQRSADIAAHHIADQRGGIDALFLPEGGNDLTMIAAQLGAAGLDPKTVHLLGTGLWDAPDLGRQLGFVDGGWYAGADPRARQNFVTAYKAAYGSEPMRLATLAYDATALAAVLAKRGAHFDQAALTNPNGFAGIDGIFRLTAGGSVERGLAVLEVAPDGAKVIDAAPATFAGAKK